MQFSVLSSIYLKESPHNLNECMNSIWINQSVLPSEMILIKDGPLNQDLEQTIQFWQKKIGPQLKVINILENIGLGKALNKGLKHCSNNWIFRMDTDDIATPDRFEKQIDFIKKKPDVILVGGQIKEFIRNPNKITAERLVPTQQADIIKYAQKRSPFNHPTIAYRKDIIEKLGGYQHHLLMEDYNLWIRILANGYQTANLPDTLLYMRTDNMHGRRRGINYIKSEWQLFQLKRDLKFQSTPTAFCLFLVRGLPRLLPASILQGLYKLLRR